MTMKLFRPKIGVGAKTWIALSVVFWAPVLLLAALLFYMFQGQLYERAADSVNARMRSSKRISLRGFPN